MIGLVLRVHIDGLIVANSCKWWEPRLIVLCRPSWCSLNSMPAPPHSKSCLLFLLFLSAFPEFISIICIGILLITLRDQMVCFSSFLLPGEITFSSIICTEMTADILSKQFAFCQHFYRMETSLSEGVEINTQSTDRNRHQRLLLISCLRNPDHSENTMRLPVMVGRFEESI